VRWRVWSGAVLELMVDNMTAVQPVQQQPAAAGNGHTNAGYAYNAQCKIILDTRELSVSVCLLKRSSILIKTLTR